MAAAVAGCSWLLWAHTALAHVSVAGPGFAGKSQVLTFSIGHGCEGADTVRLEIAIPEEVTTVRAVPSVWGEAELTRNDALVVTAVAWSKAEARAEDDQYYQFAIRISVPDMPFTTLYFPARQFCRAADGTETTVNWEALPADIEAAPMGMEPEPAPALLVLPSRMPGWNKFTVGDAITDLSIFDDAQIVWAGDAAYSSNPETKNLIAAEADVDELTEIEAGAEIWVKY
jgi:uncharacterized protein YcnI